MNQEQQRIAIAEWMFPDFPTYIESGCLRHRYPNGSSGPAYNYPGDLNAMHEAEKKLTGEQCLKYADELNKATKCFRHITPLIMCMATAAQRCEALCRTLWPEKFNQTGA